MQSNYICCCGMGLSSNISMAEKYNLKWRSLVMVLATESENLVNRGNDTLLYGFEWGRIWKVDWHDKQIYYNIYYTYMHVYVCVCVCVYVWMFMGISKWRHWLEKRGMWAQHLIIPQGDLLLISVKYIIFFTSNRCLSVVSLREITKCIKERKDTYSK